MSISDGIIGKISKSTKIYRIFPRERFRNLFTENKNGLVPPAKWDDPFENFILKSEFISASGKKPEFSLHDKVYGQCWTMETASDAMWKIYSRCKDAVRVRTTVEKLIKSMRNTHGDRATRTCFVGRVDYLKDKELGEFGQTVFAKGIKPSAIARSLLAKRRAFRHESEVRLIYVEDEEEQTKHRAGVYEYCFDPREVIDQVMVDGRVLHMDFLPFKKEVIELTGLSKNQVKRSLLYQRPEDLVIRIP